MTPTRVITGGRMHTWVSTNVGDQSSTHGLSSRRVKPKTVKSSQKKKKTMIVCSFYFYLGGMIPMYDSFDDGNGVEYLDVI